jgi:hypothetical protein
MNRLEEQLRSISNRHSRQQLLLREGTKILRADQKTRRQQQQPKTVQREETAATPRANGWHSLQDLPRLLKQKAPTEKPGQGGMTTPDVNKVLRDK